MTSPTPDMGEAAVQRVAREYEARGYRVITRPGVRDLPDFLADFSPDIIATRADESVVIEIKTRHDLIGDSRLVVLASAIDSAPRWRFELVVTEPAVPEEAVAQAERLGVDEIQERLTAVRQVQGIGQDEAAFMLAWVAMEATLRLMAARHEVALKHAHPGYLVKMLFSFGVLDRQEYDFLMVAVRVRNMIIHGYQLPMPARDVTDELVETVRGFLRREPAAVTA
jgi:hypothetical protein